MLIFLMKLWLWNNVGIDNSNLGLDWNIFSYSRDDCVLSFSLDADN